MLFNPTYEYTIIKDEEYSTKMQEIEKQLDACAHRGYFTSFDNTEMFYEFFNVSKPVASIVVVHGYTEFTKKYYELSWYFMNMGYNVFLYDIRCHGYSHRYSENTEMTHVDKFEDYVCDLECFINNIVAPVSKGAPIYLLAHSMGGTIAQMYLSGCKNNVQKAILSAPMIYPVTPPLPRFVLKKLLKSEASKFGWEAKFKFSSDFNPDAKIEKSNDLSYSRFKYNLETRINDVKYRNSYASYRWNYEAVNVGERILNKKAVKNVKTKVLIISAGKDTAVKLKPQKKLAKLLKCNIKIFKKSRHSLYTMPDYALKEYVDTLLDFFAE